MKDKNIIVTTSFCAAYLAGAGLAWCQDFPNVLKEARDKSKSMPTPAVSGAAPLAGPPAAANPAGMAYISIAGGTFMMGSNDPDPFFDSEQPIHMVSVPSFRMSNLVTAEQYAKCVDIGPCTSPTAGDLCNWDKTAHNVKPGRERHPINCVDWNQARVFAKWAGGRLPSESEWEFAARGIAGRKYPWGDDPPTHDKAVYDHHKGRDFLGTEEVCSTPNGNTPEGLCDMAGNVEQWVMDDWHESYRGGAPIKGEAWVDGGSERVMRGCSFYCVVGVVRSTFRLSTEPSEPNPIMNDSHFNSIGFRVVETNGSRLPNS